MHIITRKRLREFWEKYPNAQTSLTIWYHRTETAQWQNFTELRQLFPSADQVENLTVFNISGNNYRLITYIDYQAQIIFIRAALTHAEYDREDWKNDNWFKKI